MFSFRTEVPGATATQQYETLQAAISAALAFQRDYLAAGLDGIAKIKIYDASGHLLVEIRIITNRIPKFLRKWSGLEAAR